MMRAGALALSTAACVQAQEWTPIGGASAVLQYHSTRVYDWDGERTHVYDGSQFHPACHLTEENLSQPGTLDQQKMDAYADKWGALPHHVEETADKIIVATL